MPITQEEYDGILDGLVRGVENLLTPLEERVEQLEQRVVELQKKVAEEQPEDQNGQNEEWKPMYNRLVSAAPGYHVLPLDQRKTLNSTAGRLANMVLGKDKTWEEALSDFTTVIVAMLKAQSEQATPSEETKEPESLPSEAEAEKRAHHLRKFAEVVRYDRLFPNVSVLEQKIAELAASSTPVKEIERDWRVTVERKRNEHRAIVNDVCQTTKVDLATEERDKLVDNHLSATVDEIRELTQGVCQRQLKATAQKKPTSRKRTTTPKEGKA